MLCSWAPECENPSLIAELRSRSVWPPEPRDAGEVAGSPLSSSLEVNVGSSLESLGQPFRGVRSWADLVINPELELQSEPQELSGPTEAELPAQSADLEVIETEDAAVDSEDPTATLLAKTTSARRPLFHRLLRMKKWFAFRKNQV